MKFSVAWLADFVEIPADAATLAESLTTAGLEVDALEAAAPPLDGVVVGRVIACAPHPDADKLSVCQVDIGAGALSTIVCGAPNVRADLAVAVATVGCELPGGMNIARRAVRGVESAGMICSEAELGLGDGAAGIMELPADAPVGTSLAEYLDLEDHIIDIDLTPNRGDCLSVLGVAREVAAAAGAALPEPAENPVAPGSEATLPIDMAAPEACPRFAGRVIRDVDVSRPVPVWMSERLRRAGLRSLGPIVDVTNYVMLELGQPMHAFDLDRLDARIGPRLAGAGQRLALLDGTTVELKPDSLVIADAGGPVALAGVMGGAATAVSDSTRHIFLEAAFFTPLQLAGESRHYKKHTDASHRFERGVDYRQQTRAIERATALILEICGGVPGLTQCVEAVDHMPPARRVGLRHARIRHLLGIDIARERVGAMLAALGLPAVETADGWQVTAPSFRFDIEREEDLIEEVARLYGYEAIPATVPAVHLQIDAVSAVAAADAHRACLAARGYHEAVTYSFIAAGAQEQFDPGATLQVLDNPISRDMAVMRTTLLPGLVAAARHNLHRQQPRIRLFEIGRVFRIGGGALEQPVLLGGVVIGERHARQWGTPAAEVDFFDIKGDVEHLLASAGIGAGFASGAHPALHPGQAAAVVSDGREVGWCGRLHPRLEHELDIEKPVYIFELNMEALSEHGVSAYQPVPRFPSMRRDLSLVLDEDIPAKQLLEVISAAGGGLLRDLQLFDLFQGQGIDTGKKSVSVGLIFQGSSSTLTDEEVDKVVSQVIESLDNELGATLRI